MNYKVLAFFFIIWMAAGAITAAVERTSGPGEVAGSSADFQDFGNTIYAGQETKLDRPIASGNDPIAAAWSFGNTAAGWVTFMFKSAALSSPIWEGWAAPIRYTILVLQIPMLLLLLMDGVRILSGFIPFT